MSLEKSEATEGLSDEKLSVVKVANGTDETTIQLSTTAEDIEENDEEKDIIDEEDNILDEETANAGDKRADTLDKAESLKIKRKSPSEPISTLCSSMRRQIISR